MCQEECRVNSTDREFRETHVSGVGFAPQLGDEADVYRLKTGMTLLRQ